MALKFLPPELTRDDVARKRFLVEARAAAKLDPEQVVVAPFENRTGDASLNAVGQMAADWINDELSRAGLRVLSRQYVAEQTAVLRTSQPAVADFGTALAEATASGLLVSGEYYLNGSKLVVNARTVDVRSRSTLKVVDPVEGDRVDLGAVIAASGRLVRDALAYRLLGPEEMRRSRVEIESRPPKLEAYAEMILAYEAGQKVDYRRALEHASKSAALDPDYVEPLLLMCALHMYLGENREAKGVWSRADERRAMLSPAGRFELDSIRNWLYGRWDDELVLARERVRLMPGDQNGQYGLMNALLANGRAREAILLIRKYDGWRGIPKSGRVHALRSLARAHAVLGEHDRELEVARTCREELPAKDECRSLELRALAALGRFDELDRAVEEFLDQPGSQAAISGAASPAAVLRAHGHREKAVSIAERILDRLRELPPDEQKKAPQLTAALLLETGRASEAATIYRELARENAAKPAFEKIDLGNLGVALVAAGDRKRALAVSQQLARMRDPEDLGGAGFERARIAARLGDNDEAVTLLNRAVADGWTAWLSFSQLRLNEDVAFDSMRGYPPFAEYLKSKD